MPDSTPIDVLGFRARIGILIPATNTITQPECEMLAPAGVTNQVARMAATPPGAASGNLETYGGAGKSPVITDAIAMALHTRPSAIILGHSLDTFRGGVDGVQAMQREVDDAAQGVPMILPSLAFLAAFKALGLGPGARVAALTPYWAPENEHVEGFFASAGYTVTRVMGLNRKGAAGIASVTGSELIAGLRELAADKVDVILQPGTNLASVKLAAEASHWLGLPVIACNTACYWHALRTIGIPDRRPDIGVLFARH